MYYYVEKCRNLYSISDEQWSYLTEISGIERFIDKTLLMEAILRFSENANTEYDPNPYKEFFYHLNQKKDHNTGICLADLASLDSHYPSMQIIDFLLSPKGWLLLGAPAYNQNQLFSVLGSNRIRFSFDFLCLLIITLYVFRFGECAQ